MALKIDGESGKQVYLTNYCTFQSKDFRGLVTTSLPASRNLRVRSLTRFIRLTLVVLVLALPFPLRVAGVGIKRDESDSQRRNLLRANHVPVSRFTNRPAKSRTTTPREKESAALKDYETRTTELIHQAELLKNEWNVASLRKA